MKPGNSEALDEFTATKTAYDALRSLEQAEQVRALRVIAEKLGVTVPVGAAPGAAAPGVSGPVQTTPAAARRFMAEKQPQNAIEQVACLAFFLNHHREVPSFKTNDLETLNAEAGAPKIGNIHDAVGNAVKAHYLTQVGGGQKGLGILGENVVNSLPDREHVKTAIQQYSIKRRSGGKKRGPKRQSKPS